MPRTVLVTLALLLAFAGSAHAASWTGVVSEEAHFGSSGGAAVSTVDLGAVPPTGASPVSAPNPFEIAITPDGATAYVGDADGCSASPANEVIPVDLTGSPAAAKTPIALGGVGAFGLGISPDGKTLYAAGCGKVVPIDVTKSPPVTGTPIAVGDDPFEVVVSADGKTLWAADHKNGTVAVVDLSAATPSTVKTITVGAQPLGMALTPDGSKLYVANGKDCTVSVITTATETASASPIALPAAACTATPQLFFGDPGRLAMSPDGATLYAASLDAQVVTPISVANDAPGTPISFPGAFKPGALAFTPDGSRLLVADAASPGGNVFGNTVQIVSTPQNTLSGTPIATNASLGFGIDAAVTPDQAPVADFSVASAAPGVATSFDASTSTVKYGAIKSYAWDFGDGTPVVTTTSPKTTHVYTAAGTYSAKVTETSSAGASLPATTLSTGRTLVRRGDDSARATRSVVIALGPQPAVALSAVGLDFGETTVGAPAAPQTVTVGNVGLGPLHIAKAAVTSDYALSADTCSGQTVAPGGSCTVTVTFTPTAAGARPGALAFTDDASGSPHTLALTGTGTTTGTISGTVLDATKTDTPPLAGAAVRVCRAVTLADCTGQMTDAAGRYRFVRDAGSYEVEINPPSGSPLSNGARSATVEVGETDDEDTLLDTSRPLSSAITLSGPSGTQSGGHPFLFWDAPFSIGLPPLKALPQHGEPGTTVGTTILVSLDYTGSDDTATGAAIAYSVSYDKDGDAGRPTYIDLPLDGTVPDGFTAQIGDVAVPIGKPILAQASTLGATQLTLFSTGLHRMVHGSVTLTIAGYRDTGPTAVAADACSDALDKIQNLKNQVLSKTRAIASLVESQAANEPFSSRDPNKSDNITTYEGQIGAYLGQLRALEAQLSAANKAADKACKPTPTPPTFCPTDKTSDNNNIFNSFRAAGSGCPGGQLPVDPSGFVRSTKGVPLEHAKVTLERSDVAAGPFVAPPDGDAVMSADNRRNPDRTDIDGHFGWDVFPGYYRVRASRAGCKGEALTKGLPVPPPVTDLLLRLKCPGLKRIKTHTSAKVKGKTVRVRVRAKKGKQPVGLVRIRAGKMKAFGFLVRGRVTTALPKRPKGKVRVRYAGNARWAPSA